MTDGDDKNGLTPEPLNPKAWADINEAVGEALSLPPAEAFDLLADEPTVPVALPRKKREGEGVQFQTVTRVQDLEADYRDKLLQAQELENKKALARAWKMFREDGSLLGEYAPLMGQSTTPDTVDALWWLSLPTEQAKWELGIDKHDDATYSRVRRDIEAMAAAVINRMLQTRVVVPMVIRRKRNKINRELFSGGQIKRLKPVNPSDYPGMDTSARNKAKDEPPADPTGFDPHAPI